jgi:beta-phosphoglucomutase
LEILLEVGKVVAGNEDKRTWMERKNRRYVDAIKNLTAADLLPGARDYLWRCRAQGLGVALGSASKNAPLILDRLGIANLFDAVVDGNTVTKAKPDPEVFLQAAAGLSLASSDCVVFEDAAAGVEAARRAGMRVVGIGDKAVLHDADIVIPDLRAMGS